MRRNRRVCKYSPSVRQISCLGEEEEKEEEKEEEEEEGEIQTSTDLRNIDGPSARLRLSQFLFSNG